MEKEGLGVFHYIYLSNMLQRPLARKSDYLYKRILWDKSKKHNFPSGLHQHLRLFLMLLLLNPTDSSYILPDDQEVCFCLPTNQKYYFYGQHSKHTVVFSDIPFWISTFWISLTKNTEQKQLLSTVGMLVNHQHTKHHLYKSSCFSSTHYRHSGSISGYITSAATKNKHIVVPCQKNKGQ